MPLLLTAATDFEMQAFREAGGDLDHTLQLITGLGPVETTLSLSCFLSERVNEVDAVLNFGIGGAYPNNGAKLQAGMLDICLAEQEALGDLGICLQDRIERFSAAGLQVKDSFIMDQSLLSAAGQALDDAGIAHKQGVFITVNCATGTLKRGQMLGRSLKGLCENMEGAAVARVCHQFAVPCLEVRCISNMVEDRNKDSWQLQRACHGAGRAAAVIVKNLHK